MNTIQEATEEYYAQHPELDRDMTSLDIYGTSGGFYVRGHQTIEMRPGFPVDLDPDPGFDMDWMQWECGAKAMFRFPDGWKAPGDWTWQAVEDWHNSRCRCNRDGDEEGETE